MAEGAEDVDFGQHQEVVGRGRAQHVALEGGFGELSQKDACRSGFYTATLALW